MVDMFDSCWRVGRRPAEVISLGHEASLGLSVPAHALFDERRTYGDNTKTHYSRALVLSGRCHFPSTPALHLEHRAPPAMPDGLSAAEQSNVLLRYRIETRAAAKNELIGVWSAAKLSLEREVSHALGKRGRIPCNLSPSLSFVVHL